MKLGDRVSTRDGLGVLVHVWTETTWAHGLPKRQEFLTVQLDEGGGIWRRVYRVDEVEPVPKAPA